MSTGRDWREFNDSWRDRGGEQALDAVLTTSGVLILAAERGIKRLEPLGILLAVFGLAVSIYSFQIDYTDRTVERKLRAWEIITTPGPVNGGKREAMKFLIANGKDLSAAYLSGVDLSFSDLSAFNLSNAILTRAELSGTDLREANLSEADLSEADLTGTNLTGADLSEANLNWANLDRADLSGANLEEGPDGLGLLGVERWQLDGACGDERTKLPAEMSIPMCSEVDWYDAIHGHRDR